MAENKIKYGLKSVYYAIATIGADGSAAYGAPKPFPGAVSLSLSAEGDRAPFYADDMEYWVGQVNNGYSGSLEMARATDNFKKDVLGYKTADNGVLIEDANAEAVHFALIFQFAGDQNNTRHVMYNCTASRPTVEGNTKSESIEPQTESIDISASSIYVPAISKYLVKAETTQATAATYYEAWTGTVFIPTTFS